MTLKASPLVKLSELTGVTMKPNLHAFLEDALKMEFAAGGYQQSDHEEGVENLLKKNGFKKSDLKKITKNQRDKALAGGDIPLLKEGEYIAQPTGKNDSPDFIVRYKGKLYFIECKSSQESHPTYNGGRPKEEYIYIFSSGKVNQTTIFYGKDVLNDQVRYLYDELLRKNEENYKWFKAQLASVDNNRGFDYYERHMYTQSGGAEFTNYFTHKDRKICEENVLQSISESN